MKKNKFEPFINQIPSSKVQLYRKRDVHGWEDLKKMKVDIKKEAARDKRRTFEFVG